MADPAAERAQERYLVWLLREMSRVAGEHQHTPRWRWWRRLKLRSHLEALRIQFMATQIDARADREGGDHGG